MQARRRIEPDRENGPGARNAALVAAALSLLALAMQVPHIVDFRGDVNYDFFLHYNWAKEFSENLLAGDPYPRWIFHGRYGLGEPVFMTYSPLHYYLVAAFELAGFGTWTAMQTVEVLTNAAFAWFVYLAAATRLDRRFALAIAVAALVNPFLVMLHYKFQGFAWAGTAYLTHGMLLWALMRPCASRGYLNVWAAVAIGLAIGTHIVSAEINLICYAFFCIARSTRWAGGERRPLAWCLVNLGATAGAGVLLSAAYLLPALYYLGLVSPESWIAAARVQAFAWPIVTLLLAPPQWISIQWPISIPALLMFVVAAAYFVRNRDDLGRLGFPLVGTLAASAASVLFASELSYPIWMFQNPVSQVNLPYRFVSVTYTTATFAAGVALCHAWTRRDGLWRPALAGALGLSVLVAVAAFYKASYIDAEPLASEIAQDRYTFESLEKVFHAPDYAARCARDRDECVERHRSAAGFRGVPEYRLATAGPDYVAYAQKGFPAYCAGQGMSCLPPERAGTGLILTMSLAREQAVILPVFAYPAWRVAERGGDLETSIDASTGLIEVTLPPGDHVLTVYWVRMTAERIGLYLSIATAALLLLAALGARRIRASASPRHRPAVGE